MKVIKKNEVKTFDFKDGSKIKYNTIPFLDYQKIVLTNASIQKLSESLTDGQEDAQFGSLVISCSKLIFLHPGVILDWDGFVDENNNKIPCNKEWLELWADGITGQDEVLDLVMAFTNNFYRETKKKLKKNTKK